jgi:hypothetical protein
MAQRGRSYAGIRDNIRHGCFSTYSGNSFPSVTIYPEGSEGQYGFLGEYFK